MRIAIIENEVKDFERLNECIKEYFLTNEIAKNIPFEVTYFPNAYDFLEGHIHFDTIFMDIDMPGLNGLETAYKLREKDREVPLIFVTNLAQLAIEGYKVRAFDFCLKPITYPDIKMILDVILKKVIDSQDKHMIIKIGATIIKINQTSIESINLDGHEAIISYYIDGQLKEIRCRSSMKEMVKKIEYPRLINASAGTIINLNYVQNYDNVNALCRLRSGKSVSISRSHKKDFMLALSKY